MRMEMMMIQIQEMTNEMVEIANSDFRNCIGGVEGDDVRVIYPMPSIETRTESSSEYRRRMHWENY